MKLSTEIKPRVDGTLRVNGEDGKNYVFKGDPLECEITDKATLKRLLLLGTFFPASEADEAEALKLINADKAAKSGRARQPQRADGDGEGGDGDGGDDEPVDPNAPPVEANTPPKTEQAAAPAAQQRRTSKAS